MALWFVLKWVTEFATFVFCQYKAHRKASSESHIRTHTNEKPFQCVEQNCFSSFATEWSLYRHYKYRHKIVKLKEPHTRTKNCYFCSRNFTCESHLAAHMLCHTPERPYKCVYNKCKKFCLSKEARNQHGLFCNHNPDLKNNLQKRDKIYRHGLDKRQFHCYFCLKNYQQKPTLFAHIKRHTGEFLVSCVGCKNRFNYREIWKHQKSCVKTCQLFKCPFCDCPTASSQRLNRHIQNLHTKDTPKIKCYFCGANLPEFNIGKHIITHTKDKAYKCKHCNLSFALNTILKGHIASKHRETGEGRDVRKQLRRKCYFCKKYLASYAYLLNHMVSHTNETFRSRIWKTIEHWIAYFISFR